MSTQYRLTPAGRKLLNKIIAVLREQNDESWGLKNVSAKVPVYIGTDHQGQKWAIVERSQKEHGDGMGGTTYFALAVPAAGHVEAVGHTFVSKWFKDHKGVHYNVPLRMYRFYDAQGAYLGSSGLIGFWKDKWGEKPYAVLAGEAIQANAKTFGGKGHQPVMKATSWEQYATQPGIKVWLKVAGGQQNGFFIGHDSKGRAKYEIVPPAGETAYSVAKMIKKGHQAGEKVFGGDLYVIRFVRQSDGKEADYYKPQG